MRFRKKQKKKIGNQNFKFKKIREKKESEFYVGKHSELSYV